MKKISPGRMIVIGFAGVILIGAILLLLPFSVNDGIKVSVIDALFTAASAVCVTGLIVVDTADTFNAFGQTIVALLIQIGGLGVMTIAIGLIVVAGKKVSFKERIVIKEAFNLSSLKGIVGLVKSVLLVTLVFEVIGAILSFLVFSKEFPLRKAIGVSIFHSIAAFNNAGFDNLGGMKNLAPYKDNILLNLTTCGLVIFGGLGFFVIKDIYKKKKIKKFKLNSKIAITMTVILLIVGTILLKFTENIPWLGAFFYSTSARTAGFSSYPLAEFSDAGLFILTILMFMGASPASTGGGIKTTTTFTLFLSMYSFATNQHCTAFKRKIPREIIVRAYILVTLSISLICFDTLLLLIIEDNRSFIDIFFEVTSAFGTVGLSTGITQGLKPLSKFIIILTMFVGRLGPITMATIWAYMPSKGLSYSEEEITIG